MSMDVVQTIRQLVDAGWHAAAAALERDCGIEVDDLYGSVELRNLRDLVFHGRWEHVRICMEPFAALTLAEDWNQLNYLISRQQLLEFYTAAIENPLDDTVNTSERATALVRLLHSLKQKNSDSDASIASLNDQLFHDENHVQLPKEWPSVTCGRNECLEMIFSVVKQVLHGHNSTSVETALASKPIPPLGFRWNACGNLEDAFLDDEKVTSTATLEMVSSPGAAVETATTHHIDAGTSELRRNPQAALIERFLENSIDTSAHVQPMEKVSPPQLQAPLSPDSNVYREDDDSGTHHDPGTRLNAERTQREQLHLHGTINYHYATHTAGDPPHVKLINRTQSAPRYQHGAAPQIAREENEIRTVRGQMPQNGEQAAQTTRQPRDSTRRGNLVTGTASGSDKIEEHTAVRVTPRNGKSVLAADVGNPAHSHAQQSRIPNNRLESRAKATTAAMDAKDIDVSSDNGNNLAEHDDMYASSEQYSRYHQNPSHRTRATVKDVHNNSADTYTAVDRRHTRHSRDTSTPPHERSATVPGVVVYPHRMLSPPLSSSARERTRDVASPGGVLTQDTLTETIPEFCSVGRLVDTHAVRCVEFDTSGYLLAVGSNASVLRVCPVASTRELQSLWRSDAAMAAIDDIPVAWKSPRPNALYPHLFNDHGATCNTRSYHRQHDRHHAGSVYSLAWNPGGNLIATGSNDKTVRLQRFDTAACVGREATTLRPHCGTVRDLAFCTGAHGAECIAVGGGNDFGVVVYDCQSAAKMSHLQGHTAQLATITCSASGRIIYSGSADRTVRVWDQQAVRSAHTFPSFHCGVSSIAATGEDTSGMLAVGLVDGSVQVLDVRMETQIHRILGHTAEVKSLQFAPGAHGHWLLSGSYDGQANVAIVGKSSNEDIEFETCGAHDDKIVTARWRPNRGELQQRDSTHDLAFATCGADRMVKMWVAKSASASVCDRQW